jgi:GntR family transcriptional regulator
VPPVQRNDPAHRQLADFYKQQILSGALRPGDPIPSIREMARASGVSPATAQRAVEWLKAGRLVETGPSGTVVAPLRAALSPQQRLRLAEDPASETQDVTFAGVVDAPEYIRAVFGLDPLGGRVIRREWVTSEDGRPSRLSVAWYPAEYALGVPELLQAAPLPDPRGGAALIAARDGQPVGRLRGGSAFECRPAKADGREIPLLQLPDGAYVLAGVWMWATQGEDGEVIEYGEYIVPPGRVIEADIEP